MKDYLKEYKNQRNKKTVLMVLSSFMFAVVINWFLFGTPAWNRLQSSVRNYWAESTSVKENADIFLTLWWSWSDMMDLTIWSDISKASEIRFSMLADPDSIKINNIFSEDKNADVISKSNIPWVTYVIVKFKDPENFKKGAKILKVVFSKLKQNKVSINLAETVFRSEWIDFELKNKWIDL